LATTSRPIVVDERSHQLELHPLTERGLADLDVEQVLDLEQLGELGDVAIELRRGQAVHLLVQQEAFHRWDVPPEHGLLTHDERDPAQVVVLAVRRRVAEDLQVAGGRVEQPGEHLQGGRLAGAVRAEQADYLAAVDAEGDPVDGEPGFVLAFHQALQCAAESGALLVEGVGLGQIVCRDDRRQVVNRCHGDAPLSRVG
jgi:hypothetical protein